MQTMELLAPAKNLDAGIAAISCGADAVYIGATRFGARESVGNSVQEIERLVRYAHQYWARVYVTFNTLLYDHEFPQALQLINNLYQAGIDGLIIQDMGLLECELPPLPLIASTQTHNVTPQKVAFLEQVGFKRAILARELTLEQIREIREKTSTIELECFVHGALCVSYSGQCYLSYADGGRSGNRGQCAQPCRKRYTLKDGSGRILSQNRYLLSLKDMNRADFLEELIEAGITSFKIEGRLKNESYVKNIVSFYRQRIDALLDGRDAQKSSSGSTNLDFTPNPAKTFNRGYTPYFLTDRNDNSVASIDTPKAIGEDIGRVLSVKPRSFTLSSSQPLRNGDGLCFFDAKHNLQGTKVNAVQDGQIFPAKIEGIMPGTLIYRNYDHEFIAQLTKSRIERKIDVNLAFRETPDGFLLSACDEDGNEAEQRLVCEKNPARNPEHARSSFRKQLSKFGATAFACTKLTIDTSEAYFVPLSQLNELRRKVLEHLAEIRAQHRPQSRGHVIKNNTPYPEKELSYRGNVLNRQAEAFYRRHGVTRIDPAAESGVDLHGKEVMTTRYCLRRQLGLCTQNHAETSNTLREPLYLIDEHGQEYLLRFDCETCRMHVFLEKKQ